MCEDVKPYYFFYRDLDNGWCEMSCTLQIDAAILRSSIPYKYVIYSPKMEHKDDCYEYCRAYSSNPNRCLCISQAEYKQAYGGIYFIYVFNFYLTTSKVTAPQDAHRMLVLQVYLGSNTRYTKVKSLLVGLRENAT